MTSDNMVRELIQILIREGDYEAIDTLLLKFNLDQTYNTFDAPLLLAEVTHPISKQLKNRECFLFRLRAKILQERGKEGLKLLSQMKGSYGIYC